jgi:hypothetical protein
MEDVDEVEWDRVWEEDGERVEWNIVWEGDGVVLKCRRDR